jgi:hypothetical protein
MTTIGNRPTTVISHIENMATNDLYVQCRLANGEDGYVPFSEIVKLVGRELAHEVRAATGMRREVSDGLA